MAIIKYHRLGGLHNRHLFLIAVKAGKSKVYNTLATSSKELFIGKDPNAGKDRREEEMGATEVKTVGWHR